MALLFWPRGQCWLLLDAGPEPRRGLGCIKLSLHLSHIPAPSLSGEGPPASPRLASPYPSTQAHPLSLVFITERPFLLLDSRWHKGLLHL